MERLHGLLEPVASLGGTLSGTGMIGGSLSQPSGLPPEYTGDYIVTPRAYERTRLPTNGLVMRDDVTVIEIPYYETSNVTGTTIYIADEV